LKNSKMIALGCYW